MKFNHKRLQQARRERNLSAYAAARELAKDGLEVSHQTILNWEKGISSPDCHQIAGIVMFYQKDLQYFFPNKTRQLKNKGAFYGR